MARDENQVGKDTRINLLSSGPPDVTSASDNDDVKDACQKPTVTNTLMGSLIRSQMCPGYDSEEATAADSRTAGLGLHRGETPEAHRKWPSYRTITTTTTTMMMTME